MDSSNLPSAGQRRPDQLQIQGPRPPPLSIHRDSHKIKKPPKPPLPPTEQQPHHHSERQQPVIIYSISPKVINVTVADFMTTVQRLTGASSSSSGDGDVSPAARIAVVEKVMDSPRDKASSAAIINNDYVVEETEDQGRGEGAEFEVGRVPGILSPSTLPPLVQEMYFSPTAASASAGADPFGLFTHGNYGFFNNSPSSSGLFSSGFLGSPVLSPDFFGQIWNF
ncbi:hypothetical protein AB3S75_002783 [Citrus x aurantiifolia]